MFYTIDGPAPADSAILTREIARRTGLADLPPQLSALSVPGTITGGDGFVVAGRGVVEKLHALDRNVVAFALGEAYLVTSIQEIGSTLLIDDAIIRIPHHIFRVPSWGHRTYFAGPVAEFVSQYAPVVEAGRFIEPRRWRRPRS